jgi:hypothetical protein
MRQYPFFFSNQHWWFPDFIPFPKWKPDHRKANIHPRAFRPYRKDHG